VLALNGKEHIIIYLMTKKSTTILYFLSTTLRKFNLDNYQKYLNFLSSSNNSIWKAAKNILKQKILIPLLLNPDNTQAKSQLEKANLFTSNLENRFTPHSDLLNTENCSRDELTLYQILPMSLPFDKPTK
jgi:hypothetical protein